MVGFEDLAAYTDGARSVFEASGAHVFPSRFLLFFSARST